MIRPGKSPSTRVHDFAGCSRSSLRGFRSGASIHAHTNWSRENLSFLPDYVNGIPYIRDMVRGIAERYEARTGRPLDFSQAYWTPPLPPQDVLASETRQINERFGLQALVSLTDHDCFRASLDLSPDVPIATEWTVHFEDTFLHLGIHNLDPTLAEELCPIFEQVTETASSVGVRELLALLQHSSGTLVVLNHPLWDVEGVSAHAHGGMLHRFLTEYNEQIDALEINGYRPWAENRAVLALGEAWGQPVVAGGDRHGNTPNTLLNLTSAATFAEFADEVRQDRISDAVFMPAYYEPLFTKQFGTAADALGYYPGHIPERQRWWGRVFFEDTPGEPRSIESYMPNGAPKWLHVVTAIAGSLGHGPLHRALNATMARERIDLSELPPARERQLPRNVGLDGERLQGTLGSREAVESLLYSEVAKESE